MQIITNLIDWASDFIEQINHNPKNNYIMNKRIIDKYQLTPTWDEKNGGVYIPLLNITIQSKNLQNADGDKYVDWEEANRLANEAGGRLFTRDEAYILIFQKDDINALLKDHGGDPLNGPFWSSSDDDEINAWFVNFSSGGVYRTYKYYSHVARVVLAL